MGFALDNTIVTTPVAPVGRVNEAAVSTAELMFVPPVVTLNRLNP
jgi:hypothetical protein